MNKFWFLLLLTVFVNKSNAQYKDSKKDDELKHHQISLNGSASIWGLLFKMDKKIKWDSDSLGYKGRSTPAIQLCYDYSFNKDMSLGIIGSTQSMAMKIDYLIFKNPNNITRRFNDMDIKIKRRYIGLRFNYHVINNTKNDLFIGARLGAIFWKISPSVTDTELDSKLSANFPGTILPALAFGYKYKIKERVGMGVELSFGTPQLFAYGVDYRF